MTPRTPAALALYARLIDSIYPQHLRARYRGQMLQTAVDADRERTCSVTYFWAYLYSDLVRSSLQERVRMFRNHVFARAMVVHTLTLALVLTVWGLFTALSIQRYLRRSADQPQIQMAQNYASKLAAGSTLEQTLPTSSHDIAESLEPFSVFYDDSGQPVRSTGYLDQNIPAPPAGVFAYTRTHPIDRFTWQPRAGLRIATVVQRVDGAHPGFILVGRSLQLTEVAETALRRGTFLTWFVVMILLACGATFLDRAQRVRPHAAAS